MSCMSAKAFIDTNILIYAHDVDAAAKHDIARRVLEELCFCGVPDRGRSAYRLLGCAHHRGRRSRLARTEFCPKISIPDKGSQACGLKTHLARCRRELPARLANTVPGGRNPNARTTTDSLCHRAV